MNNQKTNVIQLFKNNESNVIEISKNQKPDLPQSFDEKRKKVSGGGFVESENLIRPGYEACLICKSAIFKDNVSLFILHKDGKFKKVKAEPFKDKIDMLKFAFANFDPNSIDFKSIV